MSSRYNRVATYEGKDKGAIITIIVVAIIVGLFAAALGFFVYLFPPATPDSNLYRMTIYIETTGNDTFYRDFSAQVSLYNPSKEFDSFTITGYENDTSAKGTGNNFWTISELHGLFIEINSTEINFGWLNTLAITDFKELPSDSSDMYLATFSNVDMKISIYLGPRGITNDE